MGYDGVQVDHVPRTQNCVVRRSLHEARLYKRPSEGRFPLYSDFFQISADPLSPFGNDVTEATMMLLYFRAK